MTIFDFIPQNIISQAIILFQLILFIYWVHKRIEFGKCIQSAKNSSKFIWNDLTVTEIKTNILNKTIWQEILNKTFKSDKELKIFFGDFLSYHHGSEKYEVSQHLAILEEIYVSQLERLKSVFSYFIILGLLGTLVGLAVSFGNFAPLLSNNGRALPGVYMQLFESLKSAFTPSILGVLFSVVAFILYYFVYKSFTQFWYEFKNNFTNKFYPKFGITTSRDWIDILVSASKEIKEAGVDLRANLSSVFSDFKEDVFSLSNSTKELIKGIELSKESFMSLSNNIMAINEFTVSVGHASSNISATLEKYDELYKTLKENVSETTRGLGVIIQNQKQQTDHVTELNKNVYGLLEKQNDQINEFSKVVQNSNMRLTEEIKKLYSELGSALNSLNQELPEKLKSIKNELFNLNNPLERSAKEINKTFENFVEFTKENPLTKSASKIDESLDELKINSKDSLAEFKSFNQAFSNPENIIITTLNELTKKIENFRIKDYGFPTNHVVPREYPGIPNDIGNTKPEPVTLIKIPELPPEPDTYINRIKNWFRG
jgi:methyl-accepting chemotaxis protein